MTPKTIRHQPAILLMSTFGSPSNRSTAIKFLDNAPETKFPVEVVYSFSSVIAISEVSVL